LEPLVLDGARRLGAKILVSGGGRCNVTNTVVEAADFWRKRSPFVRRLLRSFTAQDAVAFFREIGVALHEEPGGKLFPDTNRARTVLDALQGEAARRGVRVETSCRVTRVARDGLGFRLDTSGVPVAARRVVLATGGLSLPKTGSDGAGYAFATALGHSLVPPTPALAPLVLDGGFHQPLSGVSLEAELVMHVPERKPVRIRGALLFTHFGVSGPVALNASRFWHRARAEDREVRVTANLLPAERFEDVEAWLLELAAARPRLLVENALASRLPGAVAAALVREARVEGITVGRLPREVRRALVRALVDRPLPVRDSRGYNFAEVTSGGIPLDEVDPATMESRRCPGLFLVGEILDVDGRIGGFNFQWAWSTARVCADGLVSDL
jgi:predicted Rossmann fold flavoprotein